VAVFALLCCCVALSWELEGKSASLRRDNRGFAGQSRIGGRLTTQRASLDKTKLFCEIENLFGGLFGF
jgi:hypothetical protein